MTHSPFLALSALTLSALGLSSAALAADPVAGTQSAAEAVSTASAPAVGKMLYSTGGKKLAAIYKLDPAGAPEILLEGRLVTVPATTLTTTDGRIETSLTRKDLLTGH